VIAFSGFVGVFGFWCDMNFWWFCCVLVFGVLFGFLCIWCKLPIFQVFGASVFSDILLCFDGVCYFVILGFW